LPAEPRPGAMGSAASKRGKGPNSKTAGPPPSSIEFDEEHESALRALTVMVMGHTAVGKTAFVARVAKNQFSAEHDSDAQVSVSHMTQEVKGGEIVTVALWDVPGVQHYEPHTQTSDGASASIVVVDLTNPASFETAKHWHADMASNSSHHTLPTAADKRRKSVAKFQISSVPAAAALPSSLASILLVWSMRACRSTLLESENTVRALRALRCAARHRNFSHGWTSSPPNDCTKSPCTWWATRPTC